MTVSLLDRLSRSVAFITTLMDRGFDLANAGIPGANWLPLPSTSDT
jgi:hypothetical protein